MDLVKFKEVLRDAWTHGEQVMAKGAPGIGKTAIIKELAAEMDYDLLITIGSIADPTDPKGFPFRSADGSHAEFLPFGELYRAINATKPTIWFFDDLGMSSEAVQKGLCNVTYGRRVNGHTISKYVTFCAATNDIRQMAGVGGIIEPLKSRYTIVPVEPSVTGWVDWGQFHGMPGTLLAFMRSPESTLPDGSHILFAWKPTKELTNSACPRGWEAVGLRHARKIADVERDAGNVGQAAATQWNSWLEMAVKAPSTDQILMDPEGTEIPDKPSLRYLVATALGQRANTNNLDRAMKYLWRMPQPFRILSMKDASKRTGRVLEQHPSYVAWAVKEGHLL